MNPSKRACLQAALAIVGQISNDEAQDLRDQPDSIEESQATQAFRDNVEDLRSAGDLIMKVICR